MMLPRARLEVAPAVSGSGSSRNRTPSLGRLAWLVRRSAGEVAVAWRPGSERSAHRAESVELDRLLLKVVRCHAGDRARRVLRVPSARVHGLVVAGRSSQKHARADPGGSGTKPTRVAGRCSDAVKRASARQADRLRARTVRCAWCVVALLLLRRRGRVVRRSSAPRSPSPRQPTELPADEVDQRHKIVWHEDPSGGGDLILA